MSNKEHVETFKRWSEDALESVGSVPEAYGAAIRALVAEDNHAREIDDAALVGARHGVREGIELGRLQVESRYRALVEAAKAVRYADNDDDAAHDALYAALDALEER